MSCRRNRTLDFRLVIYQQIVAISNIFRAIIMFSLGVWFIYFNFMHQLWLISNRCYTTNLNEEPGICLFWTTLWLIATSGIHRVLEYLIRYSIEYSSSKKLDLHSPIGEGRCSKLNVLYNWLTVSRFFSLQSLCTVLRNEWSAVDKVVNDG